MNILIVNGPNLDLLGTRERDVYGTTTLADIEQRLRQEAATLGVTLAFFQSNAEGELVTRVGRSAQEFDGLIINPAGYTHTSVALRDAVKACGLPCVEVHLSNVFGREEFRHASMTAGVCLGQIAGFGACSYVLALQGLVAALQAGGGG
jgi:3-dehydroquinate dehydratase-2